jgi:hypothetical protein
LIARGLRAQLRTGNLLTGQLYIALDFFPDAPKAKVDWTKNPAEVPTVAGSVEDLRVTIGAIVKKLDKIDFEGIGGNLQRTLQSTTKLMQRLDGELAPEARQMMQEARTAIAVAERTIAGVIGDVRDMPWHERFARMIGQYATFDFGSSFFKGQRVVDLVIQNGVPLPILIGIEAHDRMIAHMGTYTGIPATSTVLSVVGAATDLGIRTVAVVNKWTDAMNQSLAAFFARGGVKVVGSTTKSLHPHDFHQISADDHIDLGYLPKDIVIVGAGPAGFYAAEQLLAAGFEVDLLDSLPTPFGLVPLPTKWFIASLYFVRSRSNKSSVLRTRLEPMEANRS